MPIRHTFFVPVSLYNLQFKTLADFVPVLLNHVSCPYLDYDEQSQGADCKRTVPRLPDYDGYAYVFSQNTGFVTNFREIFAE
jgi:hypothetical protein